MQAPPDHTWTVDATNGLDAFAGDADATAPADQESPELVWLDTSDGLDEFAPALARLPLETAATATHADVQSSTVLDVAIADADVIRPWKGRYASSSDPSRFDWMKRAGRAALLCAVVVAVADGILFRQQPAGPQPAGESSQPVVEAPEPDAPVEVAEAPPFVADPPPVGSSVVRIASSAAPRVEGRASLPRPRELVTAGAPDVALPTPAEPAAAVAGPRIQADAAVAAATPVPDPALATGVAPTAVALPRVAADPGVVPSAPVETSRAGAPVDSTDNGGGAPRPELETRAIENVLSRYRNAFNRLDADAALAVWPTANEKNLTRAFDRLEDQDVSFESCRIEILAGLAEAACSGTSRYVPKVGSRAPKAEARRWNFSLRKATGEWVIDRVDAR